MEGDEEEGRRKEEGIGKRREARNSDPGLAIEWMCELTGAGCRISLLGQPEREAPFGEGES